jgi:hypothetical protein
MKAVLEKLETILAQSAPASESLRLLRTEIQWMADELRKATGGEPDKLRMARARKEQDVRLITAEDAMLDALRLIRAETDPQKLIRLVVLWEVYNRDEPDGECVRWERMAQVTKSRAMSMMEWAKYDLMHGGK